MSAKILITGGSGFIAQNLFEQLNNKYTIFTPDRRKLNLLNCQIVSNYLKKNKFDFVIHTAIYDATQKYSTKNPSKVLENNLKMFFNVTRCKDYFGKMIYFGSGAEFSREHWLPKMPENYFDTHVPADQYGYSKYIMTKYTQLNSNIFNLRLFGLFGRNDDWRTRLIPNICYFTVMNLPIKIVQNRRQDFLCINDLARIVKWFIDNKPQKNIYNVCTGRTIDFKTIAKKIIKISGKKLPIKIKTKGWGKEYSGNNTLFLNELKGFKFTPIDVSLKYLYDWYVQNKNIFKKPHHQNK